MQINEQTEILTAILSLVLPLLTAFGGWFFGRRLRNAEVYKTEAEAKRTLAEAERILNESDNQEVKSLSQVIGAWQTLFDQTNAQLNLLQTNQKTLRLEHEKVLRELKRYRRGVNILIDQLIDLGYKPAWDPEKET